MTQAHKLKKQIRARAAKTGESYTAARRQVLAGRARRTPASPTPAPPTPSAPRPDTALGSVSDAACLARTGHGLDHWFAVLDGFGAGQHGHTAAARHLREAHGVSAWYSQGITVSYERARGLRRLNQSSVGGFQVSVSRVLEQAVADVLAALRSAPQRSRWLAGCEPGLVSSLEEALHGAKAGAFDVRPRGDARIRYRWDKAAVEIRIEPRPAGRSAIVVSCTGLPDEASVAARRAAWRHALDGLRRQLAA